MSTPGSIFVSGDGSVYHAIRDGTLIKPEGLRKDIQSFFALPIPRAVWERVKPLQDREFVKFVEASRD
jgi:hypothetical protein